MRASSGVVGLKDLAALVEDDLGRVEALLEKQVRSDVRLVGEAGRYILEGGGKRIRPALLLLTASMCGHPGDRAVLLAAVVEFIHTATLLHDDIIDGASVRRGRRSANSRWGNDVTVLVGDFLYTKSMGMALSQDNLPILRMLSDVTLRMIEGEVLEIERNADLAVTEDGHIDLMRRKTADLFAACTRIGGMVAEASPADQEALWRYGLNLGICFQMVDDLLDFTADEATLGKPAANDLREGKVTLPVIFLLQRGGKAVRGLVEKVFADRGFDRVSREEVLRLAREHGAIEQARGLAEKYAVAARDELRAFPPSRCREALLALPDFVLARDH